MAKPTSLAQDQLGALARLSTLPQLSGFYLAGGSAVAFHFQHRQSRDIDLFSSGPLSSLEPVRRAIVEALPDTELVAATDAALSLKSGPTAIDVVAYPYPPLEAPVPGPQGFPVARPRDLAAMKLAAIARRGIRRDFWDLHELLTRAPLELDAALSDYVQRFGLQEADTYHVLRSLTYFDDAEKDSVHPSGLTVAHWNDIKRFFLAAAPKAACKRFAR